MSKKSYSNDSSSPPIDTPTKLSKRNINFDIYKFLKYTFITIVALTLLILALIIKSSFGDWYRRTNGVNFYWKRNYGGNETTWYIEAYNDAAYYYEDYLIAFRYANWNPYAGGPDALNGYAYGPMFIYGIYLVSLFVTLFNPQLSVDQVAKLSVKWTHISFDALCVMLLYIIIINLSLFKEKEIYRHIIGVATAFASIWMPFNLFYVDSLYLNIPQMTFFTLLALLFFVKEKYFTSSFLIAVAWLSKQMPLFLVVPWFLIIWKSKSLKEALVEFLLPFIFFTLVISIPWIYLTPYEYLRRVLGPGKAQVNIILSPQYNGYTVTLAHSFKFLKLDGLSKIYASLNAYQIPFFFFYIIGLLIAYFNAASIGESETEFIIYTTWMILLTHVFIARGVYKYYDAFFTPFLLLSIVMYLHKEINNLSEIPQLVLINGEYRIKVTRKRPITNDFVKILALSTIGFGISGGYALLIIIKSRYLHPFLLLVLLLIFSFLLPYKFFKSLLKTENYKMIILDARDIIKDTHKSIKKLLQAPLQMLRKKKQEET